jgi:Golgi nucleoside diphosphatase
MAVANIDKLFSNAIEPWKFELNPGKNNDDLAARRYLYAPLEFDSKLIPVKITVKEYKDIALGMRLYSIEAIDVELEQKNRGAGMLAPGQSEDEPENPSKASLIRRS